MWFLIGFMLGGKPSESFGRALMLMLAWALPLGFGKLVAVNVVASLYVPASLAVYAAMIAFALYRPATSTVKLRLIEGSIMWARLVAIVFGIGAIWNLSDGLCVLAGHGRLARSAVVRPGGRLRGGDALVDPA